MVRTYPGLLFAFVWCFQIRLWYAAVTTWDLRAHDWRAHLEYINYVLEHMSIPALGVGWETHQPPLYYFLAAFWIKAGLLLGSTPDDVLRNLGLLSFVFSIATLVVIVWIAALLFPRKEGRSGAWMLALIVGTLPGIVFTTTRLSNDSVSMFLMFLWFAFLLRWWKHPSTMDFWWMMLVIALGILTKLTGVLLVVPTLACVLLHERTTRHEKIRSVIDGVVGLAIFCGWYFLFRSYSYLEGFVIAGTGGLNHKLIIENTIAPLFIFNPASILITPFANPWDPLSGREYIWEYLFRSAFFGEWTFHSFALLARVIYVTTFAGCIAAIIALIRDWKSKSFGIPLISTALTLALGLMLYRIAHPCGCNQDFRFIPLIAIPIVTWALFGFLSMDGGKKQIAVIWTLLLCALQSVFLVSFYLA